MIFCGVGEDGAAEQIDWDELSGGISIPDDFNLFNDLDSPGSLSIGEIEQFLMNDDGNAVSEGADLQLANQFLSDILLDSPVQSSSSSRSDQDSDVPDAGKGSGAFESEDGEEKANDAPTPPPPMQNEDKGDHDDVVAEDANDPIAKKRKRQLRNRDAAVRSRERKKTYVRDLELKSKYFEAECRRLGMLLQCCLAENHALRLSLQNSKAIDASMTKQESAVLLLESLLLGSLLWFLGIICLLILPSPVQSTLVPSPLDIVDREGRGGLAPRKARSRTNSFLLFQSFMTGRRCKASRARMKLNSFALVIQV